MFLVANLRVGCAIFIPETFFFQNYAPSSVNAFLVRDDEDDGYVSSECLVFRTLEDAFNDPLLKDIASKRKALQQYQVDREYLSFILRSDIVFGQLGLSNYRQWTPESQPICDTWIKNSIAAVIPTARNCCPRTKWLGNIILNVEFGVKPHYEKARKP